MSDEKRPYRMNARAEAQQRTRLRLTESAVALHETIGPARTSMSAVADHAGVRRSTLYRHFPDEAALFRACSSHWMAQNPLPGPSSWAEIGDPAQRLERALTDIYAYYGRCEHMLANLIRDAQTVPAMEEEFAQFGRYHQAAHEVLLTGRRLRGRAGARTRAAIGHSLAFPTWHSLVREQGLNDPDAVILMTTAVAASARS